MQILESVKIDMETMQMAYDDEDDDIINHIVLSSEQHAGDSAQLRYFIPRPDAQFVQRGESVFVQGKLTVNVTQ